MDDVCKFDDTICSYPSDDTTYRANSGLIKTKIFSITTQNKPGLHDAGSSVAQKNALVAGRLAPVNINQHAGLFACWQADKIEPFQLLSW